MSKIREVGEDVVWWVVIVGLFALIGLYCLVDKLMGRSNRSWWIEEDVND